jgi:hypothetical protein
MNVHWKKLTNESKGTPEKKFDAASETISESVSVFKKQAKTLY